VTSVLFKIPFEYSTYKYDPETKQYSFVSEVSLLVLDSSDFDLSYDFGTVGNFGCSFVSDVNVSGFSQTQIFLKQDAMMVFHTMKGLGLSMGGGVSGVGGGFSVVSGNMVDDYGLWPEGANATPPEGYADVLYGGGDLNLWARPEGLAGPYKLVRFLDPDDENRRLLGAVADGVTRVIVEIIGVKAIADVTFPAGDGQWALGSTLTDGVWRRMWQAPPDFGRVPADQDRTRRPIGFKINVDGAAVDPPPFYLYRAPVVLLHGLWAGPETWEILKRDLRANGYAFVLNYPYPNNQSLESNKDVLKDSAEKALGEAHMRMVGARKVDVVGHSMGGLVAKYNPEKATNVRRVVTVGTPHCGSPLANWACNLRLRLCDPAVRDLIVTKDQCILPGNNLGPGVPVIAINGIWNGSIPEVSPLPVPSSVGAWMLLVLYDKTAFGAEKNDLIVSETSQKGGLANTQDVNNTWHCDEPNNSTVKSHVLDFLDKSLSESALQAGSGLADSMGVRLVKAKRPQVNAIADGTVTITSPAAGTVCSPGEKLHVSVQAPPGTTKVFVGIDNGRAVVAESPPFEVDLTVPAECLGDVTIGAIAWNGNATLGIGETSIHVSTTATVSSLTVLPSSVIYLNVGQSLPLTTTGTFSDGATRLITASVFGTTYESSKPAVASVTVDGAVTGLSVGYCIIKVRNGNWQVDVPVFVPGGSSSYALTITKSGNGSGSVTSSPSGISCGLDCSESYNPKTNVTLSAAADTGSIFTGWSGGGCSGTNPCTVTMNGNTVVTATFIQGTCSYTISPTSRSFASKGGSTQVKVTASGGSSCSSPTVSTGHPWITATLSSFTANKGAVNITVSPNNTTSSRIGEVTIADKTFTVTQKGTTCTLTGLIPSTESFSSSGGSNSFTVNATTGCGWEAEVDTSSTSWITIASGSTGIGQQTVTYSVSPNTTRKNRSGKINVYLTATPNKKKVFTVKEGK
jgi:hypothetical protein